MVDEINQSIDIVIPWMNDVDENETEDEKIIHIGGYKTNGRPLYLIKRRNDIDFIRKQFAEKNHLLLKTFNTYAYYSCDITEMQHKVLQHMINTGAYSFIMEFNYTNQYNIEEEYLNIMDKRITFILNNLLNNQSITLLQRKKMKANLNGRRLNSLHFLPNTRKENVPFHPVTNCRHGLTMKISRFLTHLLQPIYDRATHLKTFNTSADVIDAVEEYNKKGFLQSKTLFVNLYIHDLCTIFPYEPTVEALQRFLHKYIIDGRIQGILIQSIIDLVRLFLENQYILYENKLYQQIRGSSFNSPLTTLLANIYIYDWQQELVANLDKKNEIYGRCFDEIFFTWNESKDKFNDLLNTINRPYPDMKMAININDNINYLDVNISHIDGNLKFQVAHDLNTDPYSLPYVFGHQSHDYSTLPREVLIRAIQCYAIVSDFANELEDIQLSFQYNRFEKNFFKNKFERFLKEFNATELNKIHYGEAYYDQSAYDSLRRNVFNYNQGLKKAKIKRCQRQTIQYRWPRS
ncbi:unnamed protein product [Rotaria sp. Silwood2]|nr:unnamed protein product [Rotaria sp. Silwood2]CAF4069120.1 unnamed protein product [Rotaria sp. Silwood2]